MRARIFAEENKKWWTLAAVSFGLFMIMLDNTIVNVALPSIQRTPEHVDLRARVGRHGLRAHVRARSCSPAASSPTCSGGAGSSSSASRSSRSPRSPAASPPNAALPDRRARRAGRRRRADEPGDALDHHGDVPAAAARHGDRHLGRRLGARARDRPARRRPDRRQHQLELDLLHQRPGRRRSASSSSRLVIEESRDTSHEQRLDLPGLVTSALGLFCAELRADRGRTSTAGRRRGSSASFAVAAVSLVGVRPARAAPAAADARPLAVQERRVRRREHRGAARRRSRCSASSSSSRSTCRTSSATRRRRPARSSCR